MTWRMRFHGPRVPNDLEALIFWLLVGTSLYVLLRYALRV